MKNRGKSLLDYFRNNTANKQQKGEIDHIKALKKLKYHKIPHKSESLFQHFRNKKYSVDLNPYKGMPKSLSSRSYTSESSRRRLKRKQSLSGDFFTLIKSSIKRNKSKPNLDISKLGERILFSQKSLRSVNSFHRQSRRILDNIIQKQHIQSTI